MGDVLIGVGLTSSSCSDLFYINANQSAIILSFASTVLKSATLLSEGLVPCSLF